MQNRLSIEEIQQRLQPILESNPIQRAILFGSYAKGTASEKSDVDILIDSGGALRGIDFFGVLDEVSEVLGFDVDLIEASQLIIGGRMAREIEETGVLIYG